MNWHERHERAAEACRRCEEELNRLLTHHAEAKRELEALTRALCLLRARARALEARAQEEALA
ncbi:MAG: hypothetical protein RIB32_01810 [Phycisphaerales bacterium]